MKLRDLFRFRRPDVAPEPPVPAPVARRPDWPAMQPVQRVVSPPDLITAPDRFSGSLVSWQNPSRTGTLGHYVTPDAPAGVSDGLAAASPRGELPAPAQPRWWPQPPAVQRQASTPAPAPLPEMEPDSSDDLVPGPPPAVPWYPVTTRTLVSAAGAEPPPLRLALPAVQRQSAIAESGTSPAAVADPDLPAGEPAPEAALPSVIAAPTGPPEISASPAVPSPGGRPDLPSARRFGLGAPLQRIPDTAGEQSLQHQEAVGAEPMDLAPLVSDSSAMAPAAPPDSAVQRVVDAAVPSPVQRQAEVGLVEVAPLVSGSAPMASVEAAPSAIPPAEPGAGSGSAGSDPSVGSPMRSTMPGLAVQRAAETAVEPGSPPVRMPPDEPTTAATPPAAVTSPVAVGDGLSSVQRQAEVEVEPVEVVPLVSGSAPMASVEAAPSAIPPAEPGVGSGSAGLGPSVGSPVRSTALGLAVQRAAETAVEPGLTPVRLPPDEPTTAGTPPAATTSLTAAISPVAVGDGLSSVQRQAEVEVEPVEVVPLVSGSAPMASVEAAPSAIPPAEPGVGSGSAGLGPSVGSPMRSTMPGLAVQRGSEAPGEPGSPPVRLPPDEPTTAATPPAATTSLTAAISPVAVGDGLSSVQRQAEVEVEPVEVVPLVSGSAPMASVVAAGLGSSVGSPVRSTVPGLVVQRAAETAVEPGLPPVRLHPDEPTTAATPPAAASPASATILPLATTSPVAVGDGLSTVQRQVEVEVEPVVAPLLSGSSPMASVVVPSPDTRSAESAVGSGSAEPSRSPASLTGVAVPGLAVQRGVGRAVDPTVEAGQWPVAVSPAEMTAATHMPAPAPTGAAPSVVQRQVEAEPLDVAPLLSDSPPMASMADPHVATSAGEPVAKSGSAEPSSLTGPPLWPVAAPHSDSPAMASPIGEATSLVPTTAAPPAAALSVVQRQVEAEPLEVAPLVSDSPPMASVAAPAIPPEPAPPEPALPDLTYPDGRRTVTYDGAAPAVVGLVGDRAIEPIAGDYAAAVGSAGVAGAAPAPEQSTRSRAVQRHTTAAGQGAPASGARMLATTAVQRSVDAGAHPAAQWPPGALALSRSSPGVDQQVSPVQLAHAVQLAAAAPAGAQSHPLQLSTELVVQRADGEPAAATEPAMTTDPAPTTGAATAPGAGAATTPAQPTGPTSPTEVDALVRRLYDPLVRRLRAELQRDRERAGRTLDLWH